MSKTAIPYSRSNAYQVPPEDLVIIDNPLHPLHDRSERHDLDDAMVANIMAYGVKEPVICTKNDEGQVVVVDGRRRVLHAREVNRRLKAQGDPPRTVTVVLEKLDDQTLAQIMVSLNEHRRDDTVMGRATKAARLISQGNPIANVAVAFGVTPRAIQQWQVLVRLAEPVRRAIDAGQIAASAAAKLHDLPSAEQVKKLKEITAAGEEKKEGASAPAPAPSAPKAAKAKAPSTKDVERAVGKTVKRGTREIREALKSFGADTDAAHILRWVLGEEEDLP